VQVQAHRPVKLSIAFGNSFLIFFCKNLAFKIRFKVFLNQFPRPLLATVLPGFVFHHVCKSTTTTSPVGESKELFDGEVNFAVPAATTPYAFPSPSLMVV